MSWPWWSQRRFSRLGSTSRGQRDAMMGELLPMRGPKRDPADILRERIRRLEWLSEDCDGLLRVFETTPWWRYIKCHRLMRKMWDNLEERERIISDLGEGLLDENGNWH